MSRAAVAAAKNRRKAAARTAADDLCELYDVTADAMLVECEGCGLEQEAGPGYACVVCGSTIARFVEDLNVRYVRDGNVVRVV